MIRRAVLLLQQSRYDLAEKELRNLLAQEPDHAYAHALLALCLSRQDKLPEAESAARQAIQLSPEEAFCHYTLGVVKTREDDLQSARQAVEEALRLDPQDSDYHGLHALIYLRAQRWQQALDAANEGLRHDPTHQACLNHRAAALVKLKRHEEAHQTIDRALQKDPENEQTHANLGWALLHQGEHRQALEHFSEALRLDPNFEYARQGLVEALKARYFLYRWLLRFFLWMSTLSPRVRGGLIIGAFLIVKVLRGMSRQNPDLDPFILPIVSIYAVFVFLTWVADPLFNLALQCNRYGRHALSVQQRWSSSIFGALLLGAVVSVACAILTGRPHFAWLALNLGFLLIPATHIFEADEGKVNRKSLGLVIGMALLGLLALASSIAGYKEAAVAFTAFNFLAVIAFTWCGAIGGLQRKEV